MAKRGGGSKKNKVKFEIKFDAIKRKEYLGGFKARKDERRKFAIAKGKEDERKAKGELRKAKR